MNELNGRLGADRSGTHRPGGREAPLALEKVRHGALAEMQRRYWPMTFGMGGITGLGPLPSSGKLVRAADELMYAVKRKGKDQVLFASYPPAG